MLKYVVLIVLLCEFSNQQDFEVPPATVEILHPKGFTVSIPDQEGIKLFAFHGKINEEFDGLEAGDFARDITKTRDGKWTFRDTSTRFKPGDVIHYWLYVDYHDGKKKLGYRREDQKYVVNELPTNNGNNNQGNQNNQGSPPPNVPPSTSCNYSPSKSNGQSTCSGKLLFEDNFNEIDPNKWQREIKFADTPDYEFVIYGLEPENTYSADGHLYIKPTYLEDKFGVGFVATPAGVDLGVSCTGTTSMECKRQPMLSYILPPISSGRINTKPSFSFLYGRVDIRAKLPKGNWIYPELHLTPKQFEYGSENYASGEIRIAFVPGNADLCKELHGGILLGTSDEARKYGLRDSKSEINWNDDFHIFTTIWKPDSVQMLVDGRVYGNISPPPGGFANVVSKYNPEAANKWRSGGLIAPFDKEMLVTIGLGVGGHSFPDSISGKPYTNLEGPALYKFYRAKNSWLSTWTKDSNLVVDYVKVYAI